ncbi:MAG TPA: tetraacyldisaccharide 4'-kinase [Limnobacter sp.]|nr:tetraacyldisaccharide 4'-kinase [Limnobacter sp.]
MNTKMEQGHRARLERWLTDVWYGKRRATGVLGWVLSCLSAIYSFARMFTQQDNKAKLAKSNTEPKVLVIGNLIAGGAGKTPIVMAVCQHLKKTGLRVGVVSRGYGRNASKVALIDQSSATGANLTGLAKAFGDEPVFLMQVTGCPVAVGQDRPAAVALLLNKHPDLDLIVADDGLQHHRLQRSLEWVVFDDRGQGNGRLIPAGPLREPLQRLDCVDAVLASNVTCDQLEKLLGTPRGPNWHEVRVSLDGFEQPLTGKKLNLTQALAQWESLGIASFSGLGNPEKLFGALRQAGFALTNTVALPDHHDYADGFCQRFQEDVLITSGKDAVKLWPHDPRVWIANIQVVLPAPLKQALEDHIGRSTD